MNLKNKINLLFIIILLITLASLININNTSAKVPSLNDPLNLGSDAPTAFLGRIIAALLGLVGAISLIMVIIGGFQWMTAGGNPEKIKQGKNTLIWAVLGIAVTLASYAILKFVFETLAKSGLS